MHCSLAGPEKTGPAFKNKKMEGSRGRQKPQIKLGSISTRDARHQAIEAAKIAQEKNKGKIKIRIDYRTEILVDPDTYELTLNKLQT